MCPLDLGQPVERTRYVLQTAEPQFVSLAGSVDSEPALHGADWPVLSLEDLDTAGQGSEPVTDEDRTAMLHSANTAYVIFTSGSTGRPKGVAVTHEAIASHLAWMQHRYGLSSDDVVLLKTPNSFDASVWELLWALQVGASLVVAAPDGHRDPAYLLELIEREQVTTVQFVPSLLGVLLDHDLSAAATLRRLYAGGEALPAATAARLSGRGRRRRSTQPVRADRGHGAGGRAPGRRSGSRRGTDRDTGAGCSRARPGPAIAPRSGRCRRGVVPRRRSGRPRL